MSRYQIFPMGGGLALNVIITIMTKLHKHFQYESLLEQARLTNVSSICKQNILRMSLIRTNTIQTRTMYNILYLTHF